MPKAKATKRAKVPGEKISATVFEAKTNLSRLLAQVKKGAVVTITSGREKTPVATLTGVSSQPAAHWSAPLAHLNVQIPDEFFAPLSDKETREMFGDAFE